MSRIAVCFMLALLLTACAQFQAKDSSNANFPKDLPGVRGFNYTPANAEGMPRHHIDYWINHDEAVIEFDLDLARRLNLN